MNQIAFKAQMRAEIWKRFYGDRMPTAAESAQQGALIGVQQKDLAEFHHQFTAEIRK